ncbi:hypothetical protein [Xanthomonas vesicatoria]|uniref:Uncharacterized protein n=1 Tax=Xanthomonas vesicatoria TaxID=56460 RepID=A0ABS8L440_9XANT|nr:hypothetical protein [Xanthomonas vesicatoria]APO93302.1 hypothetical protein BI313_00615 [Xanthomonas vesicatoria]MCC8620504.1 hypothetical protein [Xanthomonas vesicatoria]MCC8630124.1 hypothetical protein [Xanthomonas vesicatoria]MDG4491480.1 hypothetical protein [Xanthomonas vesicatoria]
MRSKKHIHRRSKNPLLTQRRIGLKSGASPAQAPEDLPQIPESVVLDLLRLEDSVDALDRIYHSVLSAIERQARDAISVNENLSEVFAQGAPISKGAPLLDWSAERAVSPHDAFRQLAERLMTALRPILDPSGSLNTVPYNDLIEWPDMPTGGRSNERLLATLDYARSRSLRTFFDEVKARFQPEKVPANAALLATNDLMAGFCVDQPDIIVLPVKRNSGAAQFVIRLLRSPLTMHISRQNLNIILRVNAAIATLARLNGRHKLATTINEGSSAMLLRLKARQNQFSDYDKHNFADDLIVVMRPDHLQYHVPEALYEMIKDAFHSNCPSVLLMQT